MDIFYDGYTYEATLLEDKTYDKENNIIRDRKCADIMQINNDYVTQYTSGGFVYDDSYDQLYIDSDGKVYELNEK